MIYYYVLKLPNLKIDESKKTMFWEKHGGLKKNIKQQNYFCQGTVLELDVIPINKTGYVISNNIFKDIFNNLFISL